MKRSPIIDRGAYERFGIYDHTVFLLEPGQIPPGPGDASIGDYYVTPRGHAYVCIKEGVWSGLTGDTEERRKVIAAWRLKNTPPPTHLQF